MKRILKEGLLMLCAILISCIYGYGQSNFSKLVWSDEFNYKGLPDSTKWSYDVGTGCPNVCGWGNNELQYYTKAKLENARVKKGKLIIEAHKDSIEKSAYTSARIVSKNKGDWQYGRIEIKAKLPHGRGIWPAIWMLPTNWEYGGWPHSGEIDIMENVGHNPDSVFTSIHTGTFNHIKWTQKTKGVFRKNYSKKFHVYSIEWTAQSISFFIDKEKALLFNNTGKGSEEWPFDKAFHLLLNVAVGGNWGGQFGVDNTIFPQRMEIDYVRVYQ